MRVLSRYFLASYLASYAALLVVAIVVIAIVEMMLNFEDMRTYGDGMWGILIYLFLAMPATYLPYLIPFASFGASFLCLGLSARAREILAIKAGGIAPQRAAAPVVVAGIALSVLAFFANETIVLDATTAYHRRGREEGESGLFQARGSFWYHRGDFLYNVREADRTSRTLHGVAIYERDRSGRLLRRIEAERARIGEDHRWQLRDATIRNFDPRDVAAAPDFVRSEETVLELGSERDLSLLGADAKGLDLLSLREYIDAVSREGRDPTRYRAMFHERLAAPFGVLLFTLLGVPLGLHVERTGSLAVASVHGIALLGLFYVAQTTASLVASSGVAAAVPAPWLVLLAFAGYGTWRLSRVPA